MMLHYTLRCIALISLIGQNTWQVQVSTLKTQAETKRARDTEGTHSAEPKSLHQCCTSVHAADVHELHVHIHEGI